VTLALLSDSVVTLWHDLGSIGTPALLLPMLGALYPPLRIRAGWIEVWMLVPASAASLWLFAKPPAGYWFGIEPIYIGLGASLLIRVLASEQARVRRGNV
jgi:hypothetical protein